MSMKSLERVIINELRTLVKNPKLRLKDLLEWSTSEGAVDNNLQGGEVKVHLPGIGVWCAIAKEHDRREATPKG